MSVNEEKLMAFADGELTAEERAEIERALAADPELRERVAAHQRLREKLAHAYDDVLGEPVPERLLAATRSEAGPEAKIVSLDERRAARWSVREWGAMAASLVVGLLVGAGVMNANAPMIAAAPDGLIARGALARALDTQLAADEAGAVRIGLTFRAEDGDYCRTFAIPRSDTAGLACRSDGGWTIAMTAAQETAADELRMAGAETPPAILEAAESMIAGDALDAEAERSARDAGWAD